MEKVPETDRSISPVIISMTSAAATRPSRPVSRSTTLRNCGLRNWPPLPN